MKERAATMFPYALAAVLPLPGFFLAVVWAVDKRTYDAGVLAACAALGTVIWVLLLTS